MIPARDFINERKLEQEISVNRDFEVLTTERKKTRLAAINEFKVKTLLLVITTVILLLAYTAITAKVTMYGYEINNTKVAIAEVENTNSQLIIEVESLSAPARIEAYATTELGMVVPDESTIIYSTTASIAVADEDKASITGFSSTVASNTATIEVLDTDIHPLIAGFKEILAKFTGE